MTCLHSLTNLYAKMTLFARRLSSPDKSRQNVATFFAKMHSHEMMTDIQTSIQLSYKHAKLLDSSSSPIPIEMQQIEYEQRSLMGLSNQVFRFLWRYSGSGRGSQEAWHILLGPFSGLAKREVETFLKREVDMSLEREVERRGVTRHW